MDNKTLLLIILVILLSIAAYQFLFCIEKFENITDQKIVYVFVSKTCPHCVTYNEKTHPILEKAFANLDIKYQRVYADEDPNKLFEKYNVEYVPTCVIVKGDKFMKISEINPKSIIEKFKTL